MIKYRFPEEKEILMHYAQTIGGEGVQKILLNDTIKSPEEARQLAHFFWRMVDGTVEDSEKAIAIAIAGQKNLASWGELIMQSLRNYFIAEGYLHIWDEESDKA